MSKKKYIVGVLGILISAIAIWYFFVKEYDYQIRFEKETAPGTVFRHIEKWTNDLIKEEKGTVLEAENKAYTQRKFELGVKDSLILMHWDLKSTSDSTTQITVQIKDIQSNLATRFKNLVSSPPLKTMFLSKISNFNRSLDEHLRKHKVKIMGEADIPEDFYAYIPTKSSLKGKANTMISLNADIVNWLKEQKIPIVGKPMLEVTSWSPEQDSITFNFMFPIKKLDSLPHHDTIRFKSHGGQKGVKAIFNGNYRVSDNAWFALYEYAKRNGLTLENSPSEYFYNNPMHGGKEIEWKAEVYMPLKTSNE